MAVPSAPAAPVVVNVSAHTATATWAHPSNSGPTILDYRLQLSTRSNFSVITSTVSGITGGPSGVSFGMVGMQRATNYWVRVQARNADGYGGWSGGGAFTTLPEVPGPVRNLWQVHNSSDDYDHDRLKVSWDAPASNGGGAITGYSVTVRYAPNGAVVHTWTGTARSLQVTGLEYAREYRVTVRALNSAGQGPTTDIPLARTSFYTPATPTNVVATRVSDSQHSLTWNLATTTSAPVHRVYVERWDNVSSAWAIVANRLTGAATAWVDNGTVAGREYRYRVQAWNASGLAWKLSAYSAEETVFTTPLAPVGASAKKNDAAGIDVTIAPHPGGYVTDFEVQHRANSGAWVTLGTTAALVYTHASPNPSQTHQYRVRAVKGALVSGWVQTAVVSLAAPPLAPTNLRLEGENTYNGDSFPSGATFDLVWDYNAGPDTAGQTAYEVEVAFPEQPELGWLPAASGGGEIRAEIGGWAGSGGDVLLHVRAKGTPSAPWSDWSEILLINEFPYAASPTITAPTSTVDGVPFEVEWTHGFAADAQTRVRVEVYQEGAQVDSVTVTPTVGESFGSAALSTQLVGGESYEIRVSASRSGGIFWSEPAVVVVTADFPVPAPPTVEAYWEPETATAVVTVINPKTEAATNTYPTPSFELPGSSFVLATNLCPNPTATAGGATIGQPNSAAFWSIERGVTVPPTPNGTTTATRLTQITTGTAGGAFASGYLVTGINNTQPAYTARFLVRASTNFDLIVGVAGGAPNYTNLAANTWHTVTGSVPNNNYFSLSARRTGGGAPQIGDHLEWTDITTATNYPWFLPGTWSNPDLTAAWTGAPNASSSTLSGTRALGVLGVGHQSTQWASTGTHSLRLLDGEYADIGIGPLQFKARATGQIFLVDSVPHIAVEGVNRVESGLVSLGPGWWDDVSTSEDFFTGDTPNTSTYQYAWAGAPHNSPSERLPLTHETVNNHIQRRTDNGAWITIGEALPGEQIRDHTAPLTPTLEYRAIAISAVPSTTAGPELALPWVHHNCPVFVNGGLNFGTAVTAAGMGEHEHAINTVLHQFEGRVKPVAVFGVEESWQVNYAGVLLPDTSRRADWVNLLNQKQIICYRDCRGRRVFGVISAIKFSVANGADWLQFTVTETDYTEGA